METQALTLKLFEHFIIHARFSQFLGGNLKQINELNAGTIVGLSDNRLDGCFPRHLEGRRKRPGEALFDSDLSL